MNIIKMKTKLAYHLLTSEIKLIGNKIKSTEKKNKESFANKHLFQNEILNQLKILKRQATVVTMALSLYHKKIHTKRITFNNGDSNLRFKTLNEQSKFLDTLSSLPVFFSFLTPRVSSAVKQIVLWYNYTLRHPLPKKQLTEKQSKLFEKLNENPIFIEFQSNEGA